MKLTPHQIEQLYVFTRKHYVEHYDLQTELVDHLANGIEALYKNNSNLTFNEALNLEFKKFGIFGFGDVVEDRQKALGKQYVKAIWLVFKTYFKVPKIVMMLCFILLSYYAVKWMPFKQEFFILVFIAFLSLYVFRLIQLNREKKKRFKQTNKRWLYEDMVCQLGGFVTIIGLPVQVFVNFYDRIIVYTDLIVLGLAICLVLLSIFSHIILFVVPKNAKQYLFNTYPEYQIN